jgi:Acyltransferase
MFRSITALRYLACASFLLAASDVQAFAPQQGVTRTFTPGSLRVAVQPETDLDTRSFLLSREQVKPIVSFGKDGNEKVVNPFGLWCLFVSLITGPIWMLAMKIVHQMENDENRAMYDMTGKIWAKTWLTMTNSYPTVSGNMERLKAGNQAGPCLFVANHASWLDIPVLCTVLDPVFKFIAKGELAKVPCIGTQLSGVSCDVSSGCGVSKLLLLVPYVDSHFHVPGRAHSN